MCKATGLGIIGMKYLEGGLITIHYVNRPKVIVKKKSINSSQELMFYDSLCQGVGKSFNLAPLIQTGKFFIGCPPHYFHACFLGTSCGLYIIVLIGKK